MYKLDDLLKKNKKRDIMFNCKGENMYKKVIAVILILVGIIILFLPKIGNMIIKNEAEKTIKVVEEIKPEVMEKNNEAEAIYDYESVSEIDVYESITNLSSVDKDKIIGQIISPELGMNIALFKGISNKNLFVGAGTMKPRQKMGKGNYAVAAHYSPDEGVLFNKILDVQEGTKFYLTDKKRIYEYVMVNRQTVPEDALYMIEDFQTKKYGSPILSLMTCPVSSKTGKRIFAVCKLVDEYDYKGNIDRIK